MNESGRTLAKWWMKEEKRKRSVENWKKTVSELTQETDDLCRNAQRCLDSGLDKKDAEGWREFVADPNEALSIGFLVSENGEKIRGYGVETGPCTIVVPFPSDGGGFVWPDDDDLPAFFALLAQSLRPFSAAFSSWRTSAICKGREGTEKRAEEREKREQGETAARAGEQHMSGTRNFAYERNPRESGITFAEIAEKNAIQAKMRHFRSL